MQFNLNLHGGNCQILMKENVLKGTVRLTHNKPRKLITLKSSPQIS